MEESKKKLGQEPAFPKDSFQNQYQIGMSKRFYAACMAMHGMLSNPNTCGNPKEIIKEALVFADELSMQEEL